MAFSIGDKVNFTPDSGNEVVSVALTIEGVEQHEGANFYTLCEHPGGLWLESSLQSV